MIFKAQCGGLSEREVDRWAWESPTNVVSISLPSAKICCFWSVVHDNISIATWYVQMQDVVTPKIEPFPASLRILSARLPLATVACYK